MSHSLVLEPKKEIHFSGPYTRAQYADLVIQNPTDKTVAFKLMTIEPRHYVVRPSKGVLEPKQAVTVSIKLRPIRDINSLKVARQKFMVESLVAPDGTSTANVIVLFANALTGDVVTSKFKAIFDDLGRPNSAENSPISTASVTSTKSMDSVRSLPSFKMKLDKSDEADAIKQSVIKVEPVSENEPKCSNSNKCADKQCAKCPVIQAFGSKQVAYLVIAAAGVALLGIALYRYMR